MHWDLNGILNRCDAHLRLASNMMILIVLDGGTDLTTLNMYVEKLTDPPGGWISECPGGHPLEWRCYYNCSLIHS